MVYVLYALHVFTKYTHRTYLCIHYYMYYSLVYISYTYTHIYNTGITENFKPFKKFTKEELQFGFKVSSVSPPHNSDLINL